MPTARKTNVNVSASPWRSLGSEIDNSMTPHAMQVKSGTNWGVEKHRQFINIDGVIHPTDDYALVRDTDKKILSTVSKDWNPLQNDDAFEFFNDFVKAGQMQMHSAGTFKDGRHVWALAKVNESFDLFKGDTVESYLLFSNPHVFGRAIDVKFTPIRIACYNTLVMALRQFDENAFKMNHRTKFDPEIAKQTLGLASKKFSDFKEVAQFLGSKKTTKKQLEQYFAQVFPPVYKVEEKDLKKDFSKNALEAMSVIGTQPGAEFAEGTWWSALNAVTYMADHTLGRTADNRMYSSWYGTNQQKKLKAMNLAVQFAEGKV